MTEDGDWSIIKVEIISLQSIVSLCCSRNQAGKLTIERTLDASIAKATQVADPFEAFSMEEAIT